RSRSGRAPAAAGNGAAGAGFGTTGTGAARVRRLPHAPRIGKKKCICPNAIRIVRWRGRPRRAEAMSSQVPQHPDAAGASVDRARNGILAVRARVDALGRIVWCGMPRFDSPPVFDALLHSGQTASQAGTMAVELEGVNRREQAYDPGTAVLRTRLWND